jgi:hypothetical protein
MNRTRRRSDSILAQRRLQAVKDSYRWGEGGAPLDQPALAVLQRLFESNLAADAVAAITDDCRVILRILGACLDCELHCRVFNRDVTLELEMPKRLDALSQAVADLWAFIEELAAGPPHRLAAYVLLEPGDREYLGVALGRLKGLIEGRRRIAAETPLRMGATNKLREGDETAAIGWLAEGIARVTGRPHYQHVARLAEVVLRAKDITDDRVREALRTRRGRSWRQE